MAETEVKEVQLDDENLSQEDYKKARSEGRTMVEQPVEKPVEEPIKEVEQEEEPEAAEEKPKVSGGFQKRIQKLTKETATEREGRLRAESALQDAQRTIEELRGKSKEQPKSDGEPKESDYDHNKADWYEDYIVDRAAWKLQQKNAAKEAETEQKMMDELAKSIMDAHNARMEKAKLEIEDFEESIMAVDLPWNADNPTPLEKECIKTFFRAVTEDENSDKITYYYSKHTDELEKLGELTPGQIGKAVGRIADKFSEKEEEKAEEKHEKPKSKAPTPIRPVSGGSSKSSVPLDTVETMAEYKKRRAAGERS